MPISTHILEHRSHRSRGSESAANAPSLITNTAPTASLPEMSGTTLGDADSDVPEQRSPADPVCNCVFTYVLSRFRLLVKCSQLQALNSQLQVENRIKEGAENLLQMPLDVSDWAALRNCRSSIVRTLNLGFSEDTSSGGVRYGSQQDRCHYKKD